MELTIGFISLFFTIIIPGLLFRRFYYFGEFSKQFSTREHVYQSIFYSIVPGILIQILGLIIYFTFRNPKFKISEIYYIHGDILNGNSVLKESTVGFIDNNLWLYLIHIFNIYVLSVILGYSISRFVRFCEIDLNTKLFRFKNQWYYIFSGEILLMNKFKSASNILGKIDGTKSIITSTTYADILIENNNGKRELYTGYVVDYELCSTDISKLENIYLLDAHRYKRIEKKDKKGNFIKIKTKQKKIPGEVFILSGRNIININLIYLPSHFKQEKKNIKFARKQNIYSKLLVFITITELIFLPFILFVNKNELINWFSIIGIENTSNINFFNRLFIYLILIQLISVFLPSKIDNKYTLRIKSSGIKLLITISLSFLYKIIYL